MVVVWQTPHPMLLRQWARLENEGFPALNLRIVELRHIPGVVFREALEWFYPYCPVSSVR
jgi:hypothetical protein